MAVLTIKELIERASKLDEKKQNRFFEDLPANHLACMEMVAMLNNLDRTNPELFKKIQKENIKRQKQINQMVFASGTKKTR